MRVDALAVVLVLAQSVACGSFLAAPDVAEDAGAPAVIAPDAGALVDGAAASKCARPSDALDFFCATFDEPALAGAFGFDDVERADQADVSLVDAPERTGKALRVALHDGAFQRDFALTRRLPFPAARYTLDFDLYVVSSTMTYAALGAFQFFGMDYAAFPGIAEYKYAGLLSKLAPSEVEVPVEKRRWYHVSVDARFDSTRRLTSTIHVDDRLAGTDDRNDASPEELNAVLKLGMYFTGDEPGAMEMLIDDVVVVVVR